MRRRPRTGCLCNWYQAEYPTIACAWRGIQTNRWVDQNSRRLKCAKLSCGNVNRRWMMIVAACAVRQRWCRGARPWTNRRATFWMIGGYATLCMSLNFRRVNLSIEKVSIYIVSDLCLYRKQEFWFAFLPGDRRGFRCRGICRWATSCQEWNREDTEAEVLKNRRLQKKNRPSQTKYMWTPV